MLSFVKDLLLHHAKLDICCQPRRLCDGDSDVRFLLQIPNQDAPSLNQESKAFLWVDKNPRSLLTYLIPP
ncbi:MAG: hypothetical protein V4489_05515, partial [Chlamydiota bacterium]